MFGASSHSSRFGPIQQSPFLDLLFKYQCIRTQKRQKVFYWWVCCPFAVLVLAILPILAPFLSREHMFWWCGLVAVLVVLACPSLCGVTDSEARARVRVDVLVVALSSDSPPSSLHPTTEL
jgi:hypothetical protein